MPRNPKQHMAMTQRLAKRLPKKQVYDWLVTNGYFPESYVLPPCFTVTRYPKYGKQFFQVDKKGRFPVRIAEITKVQFPKTELTDRAFGIIDPEVHSDIAYNIANDWNRIINTIFHPDNTVCSYSFPIPLDRKAAGQVGRLRSGRMIYEFIEMSENDLASIAYDYQFIIRTDIKNFYPSIYTHSIAWAIHGKKYIRKRRNDFSYVGNRLDKLFQNANDGCTNGIAIGPAVSDLVSEIILAAVDRSLSLSIKSFSKKPDDVVVVRFKDDYRILSKEERTGRQTVKALQAALRSYNLELNDQKTQQQELPDGLFRPWVSLYHSANPDPKRFYGFKRFKETFLSVVSIDKQCPGTGVIDRFLADLAPRSGRLRVKISGNNLPKIISLLLMLGRLRVKAFPKTLAILEAVLKTPSGKTHAQAIVAHLESYLETLGATAQEESENRYLIMWIGYFLRANSLEKWMKEKYSFKDPVVRSVYTSRNGIFKNCTDFTIFEGVKTCCRRITMLEHLDVFKPQ
jgi:Reverse transcriptase (RNA-dependent DNA polymerase)